VCTIAAVVGEKACLSPKTTSYCEEIYRSSYVLLKASVSQQKIKKITIGGG